MMFGASGRGKVSAYYACLHFPDSVMVMRPGAKRGRKESGNRFLVAGSVTNDFATFANALIRLDVRTRGDLLQANLHWFSTLLAFESQKASGFGSHIYIEAKGERQA